MSLEPIEIANKSTTGKPMLNKLSRERDGKVVARMSRKCVNESLGKQIFDLPFCRAVVRGISSHGVPFTRNVMVSRWNMRIAHVMTESGRFNLS